MLRLGESSPSPSLPTYPRTKLISRIPIYQLWTQALDSPIGSTVFMAAMFTVTFVALNAVHQTASRMTWSFARDNALFGSKWLCRVHPTLNVPVYALVFNGVVVMLLGVVYVCSTTGTSPPSFLV